MNKLAFGFAFLCILAISGFAFLGLSSGQTKSLEVDMLAQQHWKTFGVGGTCIPGTNNLFVEDLDGDGFLEIITGGFMYWLDSEGTRISVEAPLKVWNWNNQEVSLKADYFWNGSISCVYAADVNGDGDIEVLTGERSSLKIWDFVDDKLSLKASYDGIGVNGIFGKDVTGDGRAEIITFGGVNTADGSGSRMLIWRFDDDEGLSVLDSVEWSVGGETRVNSVYVHDLNGDGNLEIITGGYVYDLKNSSGYIRIWNYDAERGFMLEDDHQWKLVEGVYGLNIAGGVQGNTVVNNVKVGDVTGDGFPEIVTGGFTFDGEKINAQLRIWSWKEGTLSLLKSREWASEYLTEIKGIVLIDVLGNSKVEVITSGGFAVKGSFAQDSTPDHAQMKVFSWEESDLILKASKDWTIGDGVCVWSVGAGDLDYSGSVEVVTVGCMGKDALCDPDMRIWALNHQTAGQRIFGIEKGSDIFWITIVGVASVIVIIASLSVVVIKKTKIKNI